MRLRMALAAVAMTTWMVAPLPAVATHINNLTLGDLVDGTPDSFTSEDGVLTFSAFGVVQTGSLATFNLDNVQIMLTESGFGFSMIGGLSANDGEIGDLLVTFDVLSQLPIVGAALSFNGAASGIGAGASVVETFQGINDQVFVFVTGGGGIQLSDQIEFNGGIQPSGLDGALLALTVTKDIILDSTLLLGGLGGTAEISIISQDFEVIPEPSAGLLGLLGLSALVLVRRLRS